MNLTSLVERRRHQDFGLRANRPRIVFYIGPNDNYQYHFEVSLRYVMIL